MYWGGYMYARDLGVVTKIYKIIMSAGVESSQSTFSFVGHWFSRQGKACMAGSDSGSGMGRQEMM